MTLMLAVQNTYTHLQMALMQGTKTLAIEYLSKMDATKDCILSLEKLFQEAHSSWKDIDFITVNQGPGPFTTLRVAISLVNGLSFAQKIPLIGINGIDAFLQEYAPHHPGATVVLLNAFGKDLYYGIHDKKGPNEIGCGSIQAILTELTQKIEYEPILFLGNGVYECLAEIEALFPTQAHFLTPNPETVSLAQIGKLGLQYWQHQENISFQLQPIYLKAAFSS